VQFPLLVSTVHQNESRVLPLKLSENVFALADEAAHKETTTAISKLLDVSIFVDFMIEVLIGSCLFSHLWECQFMAALT
jgi:hypothetical protein